MAFQKEQLKAFDTSLYKDLPLHLRTEVVAEDLSGFILEAGAIKLEERINPRELIITEGKVYDPIRQEFVSNRWQGGSPLADLEARGADNFYNQLLKGNTVISISPCGGISPYKETRINVAHLVSTNTIHYYGIPSNFTEDECWQFAWRTSEFSTGYFNPQSIDDLRSIAIPINPGADDLWGFLEKALPLDSNAWIEIKNRNPWARKQQAKESALEIVNQADPMISRAVHEYDFIRAGAFMEIGIQKAVGWSIGKRGCPGALNSDLLTSIQNPVLGFTSDIFSNLRISEDSDQFGSRSFECPSCGYKNRRPYGELVPECQNSSCTNKESVRC